MNRAAHRIRNRFAVLAALAVATPLALVLPSSHAQALGVRDFVVRVSPTARTITTADPATAYEISLERGRGGPLSFTLVPVGAPAGIAASVLSVGAPLRAILLVRATPGASPGTYTFRVEASGGGRVRSAAVHLSIESVPPVPSTPPPLTVAPTPPTAPVPTLPPPTVAPTIIPPTTAAPTTTVLSPVLRVAPALRTVAPGQTTSFVITPEPLGVTITYVASGLPAGTRVEYVPNPSFGAMTMVLTIPSNTSLGAYPITVTGASTTEVRTVSMVLDVRSVAGLDGSPASQTVTPGGATAYALTPIAPADANPLTYTLSGLPVGANAAFVPASSATGTVMTVATTTGTPLGTYALMVTGTSTSSIRSTTVTLIVAATAAPPSFGLQVVPASATVGRGTTGTFRVVITPRDGFASPIILSVSGLPAGTANQFIADTNSISAQLLVAPGSTTPTGTYKILVQAVGGGLSASVEVQLTVT